METDLPINLATISLAALVAALAAAFGTLSQAITARLAVEATLFTAFSDRYNADEMALALRRLVAWHQKHGESSARNWFNLYARTDADAIVLNNARRIVSRFFFDIGRLYYFRLISYRLARTLSAHNGLDVFFIICEPMNDLVDPKRNKSYSLALRRIRRRYAKDGIIQRLAVDQSSYEFYA